MHINFASPDTSAGDPKKLYEVLESNPTLDIAMALPDMGLDDMENLVNASVDVLSMPGAYGSVLTSRGDENEDNEYIRDMEVATRSLFYLDQRRAKRLYVKTPKWQAQSCHGLRKIDSVEMLADTIRAVAEHAAPATEQMEKTIRKVMTWFEYKTTYVDAYWYTGALPMMIRATLAFYQGFLQAVHQQTLRHPTPWSESLA